MQNVIKELNSKYSVYVYAEPEPEAHEQQCSDNSVNQKQDRPMVETSEFKIVFERLKEIIEPYSTELAVVVDDTDNFHINTNFIMKNKKPMYFGSVKINKKYVSFHLMPVYVFPELLQSISPELKRRMQGKSCFNFKMVDEVIFKELRILTSNGHSKYKDAGYL